MIHGLDHVAIAVADLNDAVRDYEALLGRTAERGAPAVGAERAWFHLENMSLELIAASGAGPAGDRVRARLDAAGEGLLIIAFAVEDLTAASKLLERRGVPGHGRADNAWSLHPGMTDGVQIVLVPRPPANRLPLSPIDQPSETVPFGLDHVVVHTPNPDRALALYGAKLGLDLRLDRSNPDWGARQMFFRCGDLVIEIGHGLKAGVSNGPDSLGGLAWRMAQPTAVRARLAGAGFDVSEVRKGRKPGTEVFTVRDRTRGVPTLMLSASPRPTEGP
jgi:catechol 2,3-dioxygenase-like lactoylglutathione lyase family enzyme